MLNCIESFNMSFRVRVYKMLPENIAIRCFDVRKSPRINKYILKKKMPISLERKHDYDLDCLFFVLLNIFVIQTVCFNVNNATVFIFPMLYRVFSQAISLSLENGYIYFSGGGGVYEGGKAAIQHRSPCLQKIFLCYARPMNKRSAFIKRICNRPHLGFTHNKSLLWQHFQ